MMNTCKTCGACHHGPLPGRPDLKGYQCRRRPPQIMMLPKAGAVVGGTVTMEVTAMWPVVNIERDFCMDWVQIRSEFVGKPDAGLAS